MSWATIPGFPSYLISKEGKIMSFRPKNGRGPDAKVGRELKHLKIQGKKYLHVALIDKTGTKIYRKVHQLILEAFVGPRPPGMEACHIDDDQANNRLSNLRWGTHEDNVKDKIANGKQVRGVAVGLCKLTEAQVQEVIDALPNWKRGMGRMFAKKFGVNDGAISSIKKGRTWSHMT